MPQVAFNRVLNVSAIARYEPPQVFHGLRSENDVICHFSENILRMPLVDSATGEHS